MDAPDSAPPAANRDGLRPVLGVARSLAGKRWLMRATPDDAAGVAMARDLGLPQALTRVLLARGIDGALAPAFLEPTLKAFLPDPSLLQDMDRAADRLARAIRDREKIAIFADYDVDGATATAVLVRFLAALDTAARIYIPDRLTEGYGPNAPALLRLKSEGIALVVTVDCGIAAHDALAAATDAGLDVVVVDHHLPEDALPRAQAIVNPNRRDDTSGQGQLAAVGVAFLLAIATNRALRQAGWYGARPEPDLRALLDVVALGTVCDMVPLTGVNRALVVQGLKTIAAAPSLGIRALIEVAGLSGEIEPHHLGFQLGPRVNAGGRVGSSDLGARLLLASDPSEARALALRLDELNGERRRLEHGALAEAEAAAAGSPAPIVLVSGESWHAGVVGIVASRLVDRFQRPAFVIAFDGEMGRGSARSVEGVDVGGALLAARAAGILRSGGGHRMAGGFTLERKRLEDLRGFLSERIAAETVQNAVAPTLKLDGALSGRGADAALAASLKRMEPFGIGNPEPRFAFAAQRVVRADTVGTGHVRCVLADDDRGRLSAIAFRAADQPLGQALLAGGGRPLHVAGRVRSEVWQGRERLQLFIDDAAWP